MPAVLCVACAPRQLPVTTHPDALPAPEAVLFLIGDAGDATEETPVLAQLKAHLRSVPEGRPVVLAFLGDNIYGNGLRNPDEHGFEEDSVRLETQIDVLRGTRAHGIFVPGNHDWADGGPEGLERMINQTEFVRRRAQTGISVEVAPANGCPGPTLRPLGERALLVLIDTHWWLHDEDRRVNIECPNLTETDVLEDLDEVIRTTPDVIRQVVLAHHPLETFGKHGGYFTARYVFFPLTEVFSWAYVPIPLLYPIARNAGWTDQDLSGPRNVRMRRRLEAVFERYPTEPVIFGAGHEHALQVMTGAPHGIGTHLVSGAGSKLDDVIDVGRSRFLAGRQHGERGYMKLEFFNDRTAQLYVYTDGTRCDGAVCSDGPVLRYTERIR